MGQTANLLFGGLNPSRDSKLLRTTTMENNMENNMEENDLYERLKKRFKKENNEHRAATPPSATPKKTLLELKHLIEEYCDEEDRKALENLGKQFLHLSCKPQ